MPSFIHSTRHTHDLYLYCSMMLLPEASSAVRPAKAPSIASLQLMTCGGRRAYNESCKLHIACHCRCCGIQSCCLMTAGLTTSST